MNELDVIFATDEELINHLLHEKFRRPKLCAFRAAFTRPAVIRKLSLGLDDPGWYFPELVIPAYRKAAKEAGYTISVSGRHQDPIDGVYVVANLSKRRLP